MDESQIKQELDRVNKYLDEFEVKSGLPASINESTVNRATELLNLDFSTYRPTQEECQENACILSQYLLNLGRVISKDKALVHWAEEKIYKLTVGNFKKQKAYNQKERFYSAIAENAIANELNDMKVKAELRIIKMENNYFNIKDIANRMDSWGKSLKGIR